MRLQAVAALLLLACAHPPPESAKASPKKERLTRMPPPVSRASNAKAHRAYIIAVASALQSYYKLPENIPKAHRAELSAEVLIYVGAQGQVLKYEVIKAHENGEFMNALHTMLKSLSFPPPPKSYVRELSEDGFVVRFKPGH